MNKITALLIAMAFAVTVTYFDGKEVKTIIAEDITYGEHSVTLRAAKLPASRDILGKFIMYIPNHHLIDVKRSAL